MRGMTPHRDPGSHSSHPVSPSASHSWLSSGDSSSHCPPFTGAQGEWCRPKKLVLWSSKRTALSSSGSLHLAGRAPYHSALDATGAADPTVAFSARECSLGCRLHSSQWEAPTAVLSLQNLGLLPIGAGQPICDPPHPTGLKVVSAHPWLKVSLGRLHLVIPGDCSPI